jgi:hypothetical protein
MSRTLDSGVGDLVLVSECPGRGSGSTSCKPIPTLQNSGLDGIDTVGHGHISLLSDDDLAGCASTAADASADTSAGGQSPRSVTKKARRKAEDASIVVTEFYGELRRLLRDAGIKAHSISDFSGEIAQNLRAVPANSRDIKENLNNAHHFAYEIANACQEIRKKLLSADDPGISLCDLRHALEAADRLSNHIDSCHVNLLRALGLAREAAGSNEPLLKVLRVAQDKADDIANTKLAKSLQLAFYELDILA